MSAAPDGLDLPAVERFFARHVPDYRGTLSATVTGAHGTVASLTGASAVPVALTKSGGTFRVNVTGSGDHSLDTTVKWVCPLDS